MKEGDAKVALAGFEGRASNTLLSSSGPLAAQESGLGRTCFKAAVSESKHV